MMLKVVEAPGKARPAYLEIRRVRDAIVVSFKSAFEHDAILRLRARDLAPHPTCIEARR